MIWLFSPVVFWSGRYLIYLVCLDPGHGTRMASKNWKARATNKETKSSLLLRLRLEFSGFNVDFLAD